MKVLDLRCNNGHGFEGWFADDDEFMSQNGRGLLECPLCADKLIKRLPSAPRLNLSGARTHAAAATPAVSSPPLATPAAPQPADLQAAWMHAVRQLMARTEDVGERFAEEARRIHYGEEPARGIRGQATAEERDALQEEGIETIAVPVPHALKGPVQ
jgi:hypothetical protein